MIREAVILAAGLGSRLKEKTAEKPKASVPRGLALLAGSRVPRPLPAPVSACEARTPQPRV